MLKFKVHIATNEGELLDTIEIDTGEKNWDSCHETSEIGKTIIGEIRKSILSQGGFIAMRLLGAFSLLTILASFAISKLFV